MNLLALPPTLDLAPEFCFCGRKTVESHEFWFCSTECARLDSLRSLGDPECHYRNIVRDAYLRAGTSGRQPRRMMSAVHLRPGLSDQRPFLHPPSPFIPSTNLPHQDNVALTHHAGRDRKIVGFPTLSQLTGKLLSKKATTGEPLVAERLDRPRWEGFPKPSSRARLVPRSDDHPLEQISLDVIPLLEHVPARSLRRVPSSVNGVRSSARRSPIAALLNIGRSQKEEGENHEKVFGHSMNPVTPQVRKESLPLHLQMNPLSAVPVQTSKALRRSVSFAGWNATAHRGRGPLDDQDSLMGAIEEMREELSESFDPRALFDQEEGC